MSEDLTYYFSTGSRYSYLSMSQMPRIEQRYGVSFRWVPVNGKRIRALRGADPFKGPPQSGQYDWAYREADARAWAAYYDIDFNEPEDVEFDVELLLRAVIAASHLGDVRAYAWALAREVFAAGAWPLDQRVADKVAQALGFDLQAFTAACADPALQVELENNCAEAVQRGAFGTPSLFVGDELFWGNDRLPLLCHRLGARQAPPDHVFDVAALDHVVLRSENPQALVAFYQQLLQVPVERGLFQVTLGSQTPLNLDVLQNSAADLHFEVQLVGEAPISPRIRLTGQPYAGIAQRLRGDIETSPGSMVKGPGTAQSQQKIPPGTAMSTRASNAPSCGL